MLHIKQAATSHNVLFVTYKKEVATVSTDTNYMAVKTPRNMNQICITTYTNSRQGCVHIYTLYMCVWYVYMCCSLLFNIH